MAYDFTFSNRIVPYFNHGGTDYFRIQGSDHSIGGTPQLFFASSEGSKPLGAHGREIRQGQWMATGTFRNSLFVEPISQLTSVRALDLLVEYEGALMLRVFCTGPGRNAEVLAEVKLFSLERTRYVVPVASVFELPENARLFWHIEGLTGGGVLYDCAFCTANPPKPDCRLAVMMRTYGRTGDLKGVLQRFADAGEANPYYASILDCIEFWALDTTPGVEAEYQSLSNLNLRVLVGPNLGGGGNAGHMLKLFDQECAKSETPPTEVLILDDDLVLSMESLARYFMFCAYRVKDVICSLPVLMKSRPSVVWEDGGYWGRFNFHEGGNFSLQRNLFPNLLKHGMQLTGFDNIDQFTPLNTCEYSTFIFFGMSMATFRKLGYPVAFFLRGDDIEYSLRAQEHGVTMITNPNLTAWHDPAHSHGQEYMAILHGVIINLTYGDYGAEYYRRFFEGRMFEHGSIDDVVGMRLYKDILDALVDPDSAVLTTKFQNHYLEMLKRFAKVKWMKLPESDREKFERLAQDNRSLLVPFVYPGFNKDVGRYKNVILQNPSTRTFRELPACPVEEKAAILTEFAGQVARFTREFDEVRERWRDRLKKASENKFWVEISSAYASQTRQVQRSSRTPTSIAAIMPSVDNSPRTRKASRDVTTAPSRSQSKAARAATAASAGVTMAGANGGMSGGGAPIGAAANQADVTGESGSAPVFESKSDLAEAAMLGLPVQKPVELDSDGLPVDFDPDMYLHINKDVKDAGLDPRKHYLAHGLKERRMYRV
jgi:hypothetical protein